MGINAFPGVNQKQHQMYSTARKIKSQIDFANRRLFEAYISVTQLASADVLAAFGDDAKDIQAFLAAAKNYVNTLAPGKLEDADGFGQK